MKISESWLRSWDNPDLSTKNLAHKMTMIGLEANSIFEDGKDIEKIIIAKLITIEEHPNADKLKICNLAINGKTQIKVVCGATNILCKKKYPLAIPGTKLPNGITIKKSKIRGVISNGMLCSESEIGLGEDADGIMELPDDAPTGKKLINYLELPDSIFDIDMSLVNVTIPDLGLGDSILIPSIPDMSINESIPINNFIFEMHQDSLVRLRKKIKKWRSYYTVVFTVFTFFVARTVFTVFSDF